MTRIPVIAFVLSSVVLFPLVVFGQVNFVSRSGDINVLLYPYDQGSGDRPTQTVNVPASGDVNISAEVDGAADFGGYSKQVMTLMQDDESVVLQGTYTGEFEAYAGTSRYTGELTTTIVFDVLNAIPFSLAASTSGEDGGPYTAPVSTLTLNGPSGRLVTWQPTSSPGYNAYSTSGILSPGQYTLFVDIGSGYFPYSEFVRDPTITLVVPEPTDSFALLALPLVGLSRRMRHRDI